jgi:hypothetical protein
VLFEELAYGAFSRLLRDAYDEAALSPFQLAQKKNLRFTLPAGYPLFFRQAILGLSTDAPQHNAKGAECETLFQQWCKGNAPADADARRLFKEEQAGLGLAKRSNFKNFNNGGAGKARGHFALAFAWIRVLPLEIYFSCVWPSAKSRKVRLSIARSVTPAEIVAPGAHPVASGDLCFAFGGGSRSWPRCQQYSSVSRAIRRAAAAAARLATPKRVPLNHLATLL